MVPPPKELPGFYWDSKKGKYFAISANHRASQNSAGASYTKQAVKRKRQEDKEEQERQKCLARTKNAIIKTGITGVTKSPFLTGTLARELGVVRGFGNEDVRARASVKSWESEYLVTSIELVAPITGQLGFAWDPAKKSLFASNGGLQVLEYKPDINALSHCQDAFTLQRRVLEGHRPPPETLSDGKLIEWLPKLSSVLKVVLGTSHGSRIELLRTDNSSLTSYNVSSTINSVALAPLSSSYTCAFATEAGFATLNHGTDRTPIPCAENYEALSVDFFFAKHPEVIVTGDRNGRIRLHDKRAYSSYKGPGSVQTLQHASTVFHLKCIDDNRILVAGAFSTMAQYDLRYATAKPISSIWGSERHGLRPTMSTPTILQYLEHVNPARLDLGFAVDVDTGLVAASQDRNTILTANQRTSIKIFSLHGGHVLREILPGTDTMSSFEAGQQIRTMRFVDDTDGRCPKSLFMIKGQSVIKYGM